jgi:23S rRNA (adenine2030-N6)-methyltransferase
MLAYRHAFHAGNHADVLKHLVMIQLLDYLNLKPAPYRVVDTHAGAGGYTLSSAAARKNAEYRDGVGALWALPDAPPAVARYLEVVREFNPDGALRHYPGSPALARQLMRPQDQLRLFELHPTDHRLLDGEFGGARSTQVFHSDGFAGLKGQVPPPSRRGLVVMDPSYEGVNDYAVVHDAVAEGLRRFAEGTYMVWYPLVHKPQSQRMGQRLKSLAPKGWLHAQLSVQKSDERGFGLIGSGVFVINPPHTLFDAVQPALPWLAQALAQHEGATHKLEQHRV